MNMRQARRLDRRRTPGYKGHGPDADSDNKEQITLDYAHREDAFRHSEIGGFWKKSEYLACKQGPHTMRTLDERTYFSGPTWQRAKELTK